jgi:hypothetical protein
MKRVLVIGAAVCALALFWAGYRTSPLRGRLRSATVTMEYFSPTETNLDGLNIFEKTVTIKDPAEVAAIEKSLTSVLNHYGANSMEDLPRYRMEVQYTDGSTQRFVFTRTEWGGRGFTPPPLLEVLQRNGL